jgi:hypothetical protein
MTDSQRNSEDVDTPLTENEILAMFRGFLRYPSLLKDAVDVNFDESRFRGGEYRYFVLFNAIRTLYTDYQTVSREMLETTLQSWFESKRVTINDDDIVFLFGATDGTGFIADAFGGMPTDEAQQRAERQFMENVLKRFMNVRFIKPQIQNFLNRGTEDTVPDQIKGFLERFGRIAQRVDYIGTPTVNSAAMPTYGTPIILPPPAMPTGIPWIDQYIGGFRPGDVIGVLGPYSGGKTTLLTTAAIRTAELYANQGSNKLSVFIGYEDGAERMNPLFWSAATRIDRNLFINAGEAFWAQLSDRNNLKDYDRELPENRNGEIMFGERERWEAAMPWFNRNFVFLDFSYNVATGGRGAGGVPEIKVALERLAEERGMEIGAVFIDYTGIMVERLLSNSKHAAAQFDQHAIIRPIKQVPDDLRTQVAVPVGCSIMLAHQLAPGEVKKFKTWEYISHLDASGCKSFAENLHSCLCINQRDLSTRVSTIFWSKVRTGVPATYHGLIRMDDLVVDIHLVNDRYVACPMTRAIVEQNDVRVVAPPAAQERRQTDRRRGWDVDEFAGDMT